MPCPGIMRLLCNWCNKSVYNNQVYYLDEYLLHNNMKQNKLTTLPIEFAPLEAGWFDFSSLSRFRYEGLYSSRSLIVLTSNKPRITCSRSPSKWRLCLCAYVAHGISLNLNITALTAWISTSRIMELWSLSSMRYTSLTTYIVGIVCTATSTR